MQESAEDLSAVIGVLPGVEDVVMPEVVDLPRGNDRLFRMLHVEDEEAAVPPFHLFGLLARPALTLFWVHELELDWLEVERLDGRDGHGLVRPRWSSGSSKRCSHTVTSLLRFVGSQRSRLI